MRFTLSRLPPSGAEGDTSSSDGQFFRAGGHGEARADHNAHYASEPGTKFYTHVSDRFAPFYTKVIAANANEAARVLDGLLHHESSLVIREHYTDTGWRDRACFGLCHLLGFRFDRASAIWPTAGFMRLDLRSGAN
jgi:TnpA family transposase